MTEMKAPANATLLLTQENGSSYLHQFEAITEVDGKVGDSIVILVEDSLNMCHSVAKVTQVSRHVALTTQVVTRKCQ